MVTPAKVRRMALSLPEAVEGAHMGHPDFRVRRKIFSTLWPDQHRAVVKLLPEQQEMLIGAEPDIFAAVPGAWGRQGWTNVHLHACDEATLRSALTAAWRNVAPKALLREFENGA